MTISNIKDLKTVAAILQKSPEVLAVEYLDKQLVYGDKASIAEMSKFKSKVKKQAPKSDLWLLMYKKISGVDPDHCREHMVQSKQQLQDYLTQLTITKDKYKDI